MENLCCILMVFSVSFFFLYSGSVSTFGDTSDQLALVEFRHRITENPLGVMSSWNHSIHFCNWTGVRCDTNQRVTSLELRNLKLAGTISPYVGNLTFLEGIYLEGNNIGGEIPQEFGRLLHLQEIAIRDNFLIGKLPENISHCLELRIFDVFNNSLYGDIPSQLSSLNKLERLLLGKNNFSGNIPPFIGNFSSLKFIHLGRNSFKGIVPNELGRLFRLEYFNIAEGSLSGMIPSSLYNISSITVFGVTKNQFEGHLPSDIGVTLPNLREFYAGGNKFSRSIPTSFSNASGLLYLDLSSNNFAGPIPNELGNLRGMVLLSLGSNQLRSNDLNFITHLVNCTSLKYLDLAFNRLGGELPGSIANFSTQLNSLALGSNLIHGSVPIAIENLKKLTTLTVEDNILSGSIPSSFGNLQNLQRLCLENNYFSGIIPPSFGNLTNLLYLKMYKNILDGNIPPSLGNCHSLFELNLESNNLNGTIPKEVFSLTSLTIIRVSSNFLSGSPPLEVGSSSNLRDIYLSDNRLSGKISSSIALYQKLENLYMGGNLLEGTVPESLSALRGMRVLDLSRNNLSGEIPIFLANFPFLEHLNLSFNGFVGEIPRKGIFTNVSTVFLNGNDDICGGIPELHLPACPKETSKNGKSSSKSEVSGKTIAVIVSGICIMFLLLIIFVLYWGKRKIKCSSNNNEWPSSISFSQLFKSTNGFSSDCLIGVGSFGSVYRGEMNNGVDIVAVKVLHLQQCGASNSFIAECRALKNVRHRNLVKIVTVCSSVDFQGNDFKSLIYEFMPNGSLEQWLHPNSDELNKSGTMLNLIERLNIAIDVANALEYLHCHSEIPIAHCDLKPSNVLLDEGMAAHVGDFGLAKFLLETNNDSLKDSLSTGLKGSIGYIAPEYGMGGQVSILGDVYSYGILLLEMFTGNSPTNDMFQDGLSLHEFSKMALTEQFMEVLDPALFSLANVEDHIIVEATERNVDISGSSRNDVQKKLQECAVEVVRIGLCCSMHSPNDRLTMGDVVKKLLKIRDLYSQTFIAIENTVHHTPSCSL